MRFELTQMTRLLHWTSCYALSGLLLILTACAQQQQIDCPQKAVPPLHEFFLRDHDRVPGH
jgi:hypothetical protein